MADPKFIDGLPIGRIFLALNNPRHETYDTEGKVIAYLCQKEAIYPLAKDIVKWGLNPLERFALSPGTKKRDSTAPTYVSAEGNRRLCALKLLNDSELAPANLRKGFEKLAEQWEQPITKVSVAIFEDPEDPAIDHWLERIHNGLQGGAGRKDWSAEQKQRFYGGSKNREAQALLDYAENEGFISKAERAGKLTTVQRFLDKELFREALGLEQSDDPAEFSRTRPKSEFDILVKRFMRDAVGKKDVTSRMNKEEIVRYARTIAGTRGVTSTRIEPEPISADTDKKGKGKRRKKPKKPEHAKHIQYEEEIQKALLALKNEKLLSLYHSMCEIDLDPHTPIVAIGTWAFFETLTTCAGKTDSVTMDGFLSKAKLISYAISSGANAVREALGRVRAYGNTTKHHAIAGTFNGDQLHNDMNTLKPVILKLVEEASAKPR